MKAKHMAWGLALLAAAGARAETQVGVSVSVNQPGLYGRIDIGNSPPPAVIFPQPVIIRPAPVQHRPVYLRVPPGHEKNWGKHCHKYDACAQPVYFVKADARVSPHDRHGDSRDEHRGGRHGGKGEGKGHKHD